MERATELLRIHGCRALTMERVARELGVFDGIATRPTRTRKVMA